MVPRRLSCEVEADREYKRQFPDGPQPIATFKLAKGEGVAAAFDLLRDAIGSGAITAAEQEARLAR